MQLMGRGWGFALSLKFSKVHEAWLVCIKAEAGEEHWIRCSAAVLWEGTKELFSQDSLPAGLSSDRNDGSNTSGFLLLFLNEGKKAVEEHVLDCLRLCIQWAFSYLPAQQPSWTWMDFTYSGKAQAHSTSILNPYSCSEILAVGGR